MKPIREIVIREWLPGSYTVTEDGRETSCPSREQLYTAIRHKFGRVSDPDDLEEINDLKQDLYALKAELRD